MTAPNMALLMEGGDPMSVDGSSTMPAHMRVMPDMGITGAPMTLDDVDLFGDAVMNNALDALPPAPGHPPPSRALQRRIAELRARGCCQGIAWSRQGTIASISADGMSIELRFLRTNPENGDWELTDAALSLSVALVPASSPSATSSSGSGTSNTTVISAGAPFVHLAWAPSVHTSSFELAAIDALGRITIFLFTQNINKPYLSRKWDTDPVDDLHAVVGCYWLPLPVQLSKGFNVSYVANWVQTDYRYEPILSPAWGPIHPNHTKSALVCVTTNGLLKMLFPQNNNRIEETSIELESVTASDDLITHAAIGADRNTLLIALAMGSKQLRVVRVGIQWGLPQVDKQQMPPSVPLRPSLRESRVAVTTLLDPEQQQSDGDAPIAQLTHLEILPSPLGETPQTVLPPVILAVRSYLPQEGSLYAAHQEPFTVIDRWELFTDQPKAFHPAFEQLGAKNSASSQPSAMQTLRKLDPVVIPGKVVVTVNTLQFGRVVCFGFSDGTLQYRDRFTMNEVYTEQATTNITSPLQVGFQWETEGPCLQMAFAPTNCSFVQVSEDGSVKWVKLRYPVDDPNMTLQGPKLKAVAASLAVASVGANIAGPNIHNHCDDVMAIARPLAKKFKDFPTAWVREFVTMFKITVDYSEEAHHDQLMRNSLLQFCLSILNHFGFNGDFQPRTFSGKFANLALAVRNIVVLITIASNAPNTIKEKLSPLDEPEVVDALASCAKWGFDLLAWLTDRLLALSTDQTIKAMLADQKRFPDLARYLHSKNDVSLHLLLCSSTRGLLSAVCRRLQVVESLAHRATVYYESRYAVDPAAAAQKTLPPLYHAYVKMQRVVTASLVKASDFDKLLTALSRDIQTAYIQTFSGVATQIRQHASGSGGQPLTEQQQQQCNEQFIKKAQSHVELDMLLGQNPPPGFREVLACFFGNIFPAFRATVDPRSVFFADWSLLEEIVAEDERTLKRRREGGGRYVDVFKRVELCGRGQVLPRGRIVASVKTERAEAVPMVPSQSQSSHQAASQAQGQQSQQQQGATPAPNATPSVPISQLNPPTGPTQPPNSSGNTANANPNTGTNANTLGGSVPGLQGFVPVTANLAVNASQWRRCVRCAAVMEDVWGQRPGFTFVLTQQRRCACGGGWGLVPRGD